MILLSRSTGETKEPARIGLSRTRTMYYIKVTVHVGTDQNIEIEIFAEYKYTLNELPVNFFFNLSNSLRDMANESLYWKSKLFTLMRTLGANFLNMFWLKLRQCKGSILLNF